MKNTLLNQFREAEIKTLKNLFSPNFQVLEIGGGSGFQAKIISSWGCNVTSIDIYDHHTSHEENYYPVQTYNGQNLPFADDSFDVVFSSNVLEHITLEEISQSLSEIHRVLKPDGVAIHILPTSAWRLWTSITHYVYLFKKYVLQKHIGKSNTNVIPKVSDNSLQKQSFMKVFKKALLAEPHGEYPSAISELYYFSHCRWFQLFEKHRFKVTQSFTNNLFYTGYTIFPFLDLKRRKLISFFLGSACHIYILQKN